MTRRRFFSVSAAGLAAGAVSAATPAAHGMELHLSCGAIGVKATQEQAIEYAARYGFDSVDADGGYLGSLNDEALARLLADMKARNVKWALAGLPVDFRKDDAVFSTGMAKLRPYAEALGRAGVTRVTTWILPSDATRTYLVNLRTHARRLREIAAVLDASRLRFGLEYVGPRTALVGQRYPFVHTLAETQDLIAETGARNVGIVLDSWHWYCARDTTKDLLSLKPADIVSVDLNDAPAGIPLEQQIDSRRELPAATGVIDVKAFLGALKEIGWTGPVRAEPFNEALRKMAPEDALRATKAAMDKAFAQIA